MWMLKSLSKLDDPDIKVHVVCIASFIHLQKRYCTYIIHHEILASENISEFHFRSLFAFLAYLNLANSVIIIIHINVFIH